MTPKSPIKVTADFTETFNESIERFKKNIVLVGIPEEETTRENKVEKERITNAALLAINNFGSPINNIPSRPVVEIGLRNARPEITMQFKLAAQNILKKGASALQTYYERIGFIASNSIKRAINDQGGIEEPAESTLASRKSRGFKGTKALVVTGQMRNAITFVVRSIWRKL